MILCEDRKATKFVTYDGLLYNKLKLHLCSMSGQEVSEWLDNS